MVGHKPDTSGSCAGIGYPAVGGGFGAILHQPNSVFIQYLKFNIKITFRIRSTGLNIKKEFVIKMYLQVLG